MTNLRMFIATRTREALDRVLATVRGAGDDGQTLTEYALILALIAVAVVAALLTLGGQLTTLFNNVSSNL